MTKKYITSDEKALFQREMGNKTQKRQKYLDAIKASGLYVDKNQATGPSIEDALKQFHRNQKQQASLKTEHSTNPTTPFDHIRASTNKLDEVKSEDALYFHRGGLQHRVVSQLKRGQIPIGAELDLHGMTLAEADARMVDFLSAAHDRNIRCVRIIHGKNHRHAGKKPVIKNYVNQLLRERPDVMAFCSAPLRQGGTGAVLVLLRSLDKIK